MRRFLVGMLIVALSLSMILVLHDQQEMRRNMAQFEQNVASAFMVVLSDHTPVVNLASIVRIESNLGGHGTGFIVGENQVITARHVAEMQGDLVVVTHGGQRLTPVVIHKDPDSDAALIVVDIQFPLEAQLELSERELERGEHVQVIGFPLEFPITVSPARVIAIDHHIDDIRLWSTTNLDVLGGDMAPGQSGSPVLDSDGKVVGIWVMFRGDFRTMSMSVPTSEFIVDLLGDQ